jgi:hypothetical protein
MLRRIQGPFREFGFAPGLLYAIDRVLSAISPKLRLHVYEFMVQPITDKPLLPRNFKRQLVVREIKAGDAEMALMPVRPDLMAARLRNRATCLGALKDDVLIGYMWFCSPAYDEDEVRCTYLVEPAGEAVFDFDFYLFPEYRLGLGFVALWNGANEYLTQRGIRYTFSRLTRFNLASRRAHQHLGWKRVGRALFLKAWQVEVMVSTVHPYVHVSPTASGRARVRLSPRALDASNNAA